MAQPLQGIRRHSNSQLDLHSTALARQDEVLQLLLTLIWASMPLAIAQVGSIEGSQ